jgi:hypothetical protein
MKISKRTQKRDPERLMISHIDLFLAFKQHKKASKRSRKSP